MDYIKKLKIAILNNGINTEDCSDILEKIYTKNIFSQDYPTTSQLNLSINEICINCTINPNSKIKLSYAKNSFTLIYGNRTFNVNIQPLPPYLGRRIRKLPIGPKVDDIVLTIGDRLRITTLSGCSFKCKYCNINTYEYYIRKKTDIMDAIKIANLDPFFKPKHALLSGGVPKDKDIKKIDKLNENIIEFLNNMNLPVEMMITPRKKEHLERLKKIGVKKIAINMEIFNEDSSEFYNPQKYKLRSEYWKSIRNAVKIFGKGNVRSVLIIGLEKLEDTIQGVQKLSELGSDVVLSPFKEFHKNIGPVQKPTDNELYSLYKLSKKITRQNDVNLGPRCLKCQHNAIVFPDDNQ